MKKIDEIQLSFDFALNDKGTPTVDALSGSNNVVHFNSYIQSKQKEKNAPLYQKIFDSIKHIG